MQTYDACSQAHELTLEQIAAQAKAHISVGEKYKDKADQQYIAAGLYLIAAKARVKAEGKLWIPWVEQNVDISERRAQQLMEIAGGKTTIEELRERNAERNREFRARQAQPERANPHHVMRKGPTKAPPPQKPISEEEKVRRQTLTLRFEVRDVIDELTITELLAVKEFINTKFGKVRQEAA